MSQLSGKFIVELYLCEVYFFVFFCLFVVFRPVRGYFTHIGTFLQLKLYRGYLRLSDFIFALSNELKWCLYSRGFLTFVFLRMVA